MNWKSLLGLAGAAGASIVVGCGGNVVVDGPGGGGSGGAGGATTLPQPTGGSAGGTTITPSTTTTDVNPATYCKYLCNQAAAYGCLAGGSAADCLESCSELFLYYAGCEGPLTTFYDCVVVGLQDDCAISDECEDEGTALEDCVDGPTPCTEYGCAGGSDGSCSCEGSCEGNYVVTDCYYSANGFLSCDCYSNGQVVAVCDQPQNSCGIADSCCTKAFLEDN